MSAINMEIAAEEERGIILILKSFDPIFMAMHPLGGRVPLELFVVYNEEKRRVRAAEIQLFGKRKTHFIFDNFQNHGTNDSTNSSPLDFIKLDFSNTTDAQLTTLRATEMMIVSLQYNCVN